MSGEMNRRNAELSEAELAGVSGGVDDDRLAKAYLHAAKEVCSTCDRKASGCDYTSDLATYMEARDFISSPQACLYYRE